MSTKITIFSHFENLEQLLKVEYQALLGTDMDKILNLQKEKEIILEKITSFPKPTSELPDNVKDKIDQHLKNIKKQTKINSQIALKRAELTHAKLNFITEQLAPAYQADGKNQPKNSGSLINLKT